MSQDMVRNALKGRRKRKPSYGFWSGFWDGVGALSFLYAYQPKARRYERTKFSPAKLNAVRVSARAIHGRDAA
jgi:hypothetical protein